MIVLSMKMIFGVLRFLFVSTDGGESDTRESFPYIRGEPKVSCESNLLPPLTVVLSHLQHNPLITAKINLIIVLVPG